MFYKGKHRIPWSHIYIAFFLSLIKRPVPVAVIGKWMYKNAVEEFAVAISLLSVFTGYASYYVSTIGLLA